MNEIQSAIPDFEHSAASPVRNRGDGLLDFTFIESFDDLTALEAEWNELDKAVGKPGNVFQTFPWCWHWANHLTTGDNAPWKLKILTGRKSGRLVLVWPLAIHLAGIVNEARWLGEPLTQYGDVLVAHDPVSEAWLLEALRHLQAQSDIDLLHLRKVRDDAAIAPLLKSQAYKLPGTEQAPCLDLSKFENYEEYSKTLSGKMRRDCRRKQRRLADMGTLRFEHLEAGPKAEAALSTAIAFKNAWLKDSGRHNTAFNDDATVAALLAMIRGEERPVGCLVSVMSLDHETLAVSIGFTHCGTYFAHMGAFNPWFRVHSPGKVQMPDTIKSLIERKFKVFDLMAPEDHYKTEWTDTLIETGDHALPFSLRGVTHMGVYLRLVRPGLKTLYQKMPTALRRQAARFA